MTADRRVSRKASDDIKDIGAEPETGKPVSQSIEELNRTTRRGKRMLREGYIGGESVEKNNKKTT
jgi:hypothetical protein